MRSRFYLKNLPSLVANLFFVGLGANSPPALVSTRNLGAMVVSRRRAWCGCGRGVASSALLL